MSQEHTLTLTEPEMRLIHTLMWCMKPSAIQAQCLTAMAKGDNEYLWGCHITPKEVPGNYSSLAQKLDRAIRLTPSVINGR